MMNFINCITRLILILIIRWTGHAANKSTLKMLAGKPARKKPLRSTSRRWEENIRKSLKKIGVNMRNWIDPA